MKAEKVYLMYHEIQMAGRRACRSEQGYLRYCITEREFRNHMASIRANNLRGMSVTEALAANGGPEGVAVTFDDGCETDLIFAAPLLKDFGFNATFYVVGGYLNRRGYLSESQLRELSDLGFEIGSHSMTHSYLSDLGSERLKVEILESKDLLEQVTGRRVDHFSCPGGRWDARVARAAREAGYSSVATSRIGANSGRADRFRLARIPIMRGTDIADFGRTCRAEGLFARQARVAMLSTAKSMLGNSMYERVRSAVLKRSEYEV